MSEETPDTAELAPAASGPQPIKFIIFETIVHGQQIFHPGQEQALFAASLPIGTLRHLIEGGAIRGQYPGMETLQKNAGSFTQHKTGK